MTRRGEERIEEERMRTQTQTFFRLRLLFYTPHLQMQITIIYRYPGKWVQSNGLLQDIFMSLMRSPKHNNIML